MNVVFSANNLEEVITLPFVPSDFSVPTPWVNQEFDTIAHGTINLIGLKGLRTLSISSIFPNNDYHFAKSSLKASEGKAFFQNCLLYTSPSPRD